MSDVATPGQHQIEAQARAAADAARRRNEMLLRLSIELSGTMTSGEVSAVVVRHVAQAFDADAVGVFGMAEDGRSLTLLSQQGFTDRAQSAYHEFLIDADSPVAAVARTGDALWVFGRQRLETEFPNYIEDIRSYQREATGCIPLRIHGRIFGVLTVGFNRPTDLGTDERTYAALLAEQCAQALERARLYEAERIARAEAEAANKAKSEFLTMMSHELRTPLNAIAGYTELLELGIHGPVTTEQREALSRIQNSQRHLLSLINEVLSYARLEASAVTYTLRPVNVGSALARAESFVLPLAQSRGLEVTVDSVAGLVVMADEEKMNQVLLNLLSNAMKFTERGYVRVTAQRLDPDTIEIAVSDSGVGIAADQLERVFEPFVQVGRQLNNPREGTGLGLAISRELARGMDGELTAESVVGVGSTFRLKLPTA